MARPLGKNINAENRTFGVNLDNYMASDTRLLFPGMGFTLEPGITIENEYQLRFCNNVYIDGERVCASFGAAAGTHYYFERITAKTVAPPGDGSTNII